MKHGRYSDSNAPDFSYSLDFYLKHLFEPNGLGYCSCDWFLSLRKSIP